MLWKKSNYSGLKIRMVEYWVALHNFYVITRYNHSALYAMAVYQLADAIKTRYQSGP